MPTEQKYAIHENLMEWLPQQILSRQGGRAQGDGMVLADAQAGRAIDRDRPGQFYGMCTIHTITGEVFTKTTYRMEEQWRNNKVYRAVVEDYQVLDE